MTRQRHDKFGHRTYYEEFLEAGRVSLVTAAIQTAATPTKDADNPLFPEAAEATSAWDRNKAYVSVVRVEDPEDDYTWHMFYSGSDTDQTTYRTGYAFSKDGTTFQKPYLGISSAGDNVLRDGYCNHVVYDEYSGLWVSVEENFTAGQIKLYTQENPTDVPTLIKTLTPSQSNSEGKSIVRRPTDHRWIVYYNHGHGAQDRSVSAFISDTTDLDGTWTEYGSELLSAPDQDNQFYSIYGTPVGDQIIYTVARYNKTTEQIDVDLYTSRNGIDLTSIADSWIPLGSGGAWDDEMIWGTSNLVVEDDSWHVYYVGSPEDHTIVNSDRRFGRVTVNRGRIGSAGTTGTITTDYLHVGPGAVFTVNADASAGTLEIEVQDANGDPITGFAQTDFTDITTDAYDHHPVWGQETIPAGTIRLVFTLTTDVTVYDFELTNTVPASAVAGGTDADAIHDNVAGEISAITEKTSPVSADLLIIEDSADSNNKKRVQVGNLPGGGGGAAYVGGFGEDNLAASLTDSQLYRNIQGVTAQSPLVVDRTGSIIGIAVASTEARTAGTATFEVFKNGTGIGLTTTLDATDTQYNTATQAGGVDTFVAGDRLDVRVTTDGTWAPTTADVECWIILGSEPTAAPEWVLYLAGRQPDETAHTDDDMFGSDSSADYTTQTVSGTATWTIGRGVLSVKADDQTLGDVSAFLKSITSASSPMTVETSVQIFAPEVSASEFAMAGILFTDGTATTSNSAAFALELNGSSSAGQLFERRGTLTDFQADGSTGLTGGLFVGSTPFSRAYLRLIWSAANTFEVAVSGDGVTWTDRGATTFSQTMTPTHFGFWVSTQGGNDEFLASFDYFRVYDSDLSV